MPWHKLEPFEPECGPHLSPEHLDRLAAEHKRVLDNEQDRIYQGIKMRLQLGPLTWPGFPSQ